MNATAPALEGVQRTLTIATVGAHGDGVGDGGVFVPLTLPGERVEAMVSGPRAELLEVLEPSPDRVTPLCPHFGDCGGCALQHWAPGPYLEWKREQIRVALDWVGIETDILEPFAAAPGTRRRLALHARRHGRLAVLGFKARRSWRLSPLETCVIADPRLVAALPALRRLAEPFLEHPKSAPILHVTLTQTGLDIEVSGVERRGGGLSADARMRIGQFAGEADIARVTLGGEVLFQVRQSIVTLGGARVALPPGAFLQAVPAAELAIGDFILAAAAGSRSLADLYCGVGTFTFRLAGLAPVLAADSSAGAIEALRAAAATVPGLSLINAQVRDLDRRPILGEEFKGIDTVVFDPPRAGAEAQCGQLARSKVTRVIGVSCNPTTFARDAKILTQAGFRLQRVLPADQFLWSAHTELVGVFHREGS